MAESKPKVAPLEKSEPATEVVKEVVVPKTIREHLHAEGKRVYKEVAKDVHQFVPVYPQPTESGSVNVRDRDNLYKKSLY